MDYLDELDSFVASVAPAEGGTGGHPIGKFAGIVNDIAQKRTTAGTSYWDLTLKTTAGTTWVKIFDISEAEIIEARSNPTKKELLGKQVARTKRYFVDLGLATGEQVHAWKWRDLLGNIAHLRSRPCEVVVQANTRKPGETITFMNAPTSDPVAAAQGSAMAPPSAGIPVTSAGIPVTSAGIPVTSAGIPVTSAGIPITSSPAVAAPGSQPAMDQIPF